MARNLDTTMAAALPDGLIQPAMMAQITFNSGVEYVWSGVGDLSWNGQTWKGLGSLARVGAITENVVVQAEGTTVTLDGVGLSDLPIVLGVTPPSPPFAAPAGQSVAWSLPSAATGSAAFSYSQPLPAPGFTVTGSANVTPAGGTLQLTGGSSTRLDMASGVWSGFAMPLEVPPGAVITGIYPVVVVSTLDPNGTAAVGAWPTLETPPTFLMSAPSFAVQPTSAVAVGSNVCTSLGDTLGAWCVGAYLGSTSNQGTPAGEMVITFVGCAVYYVGTPLTQRSMIQEALTDIRVGGAAKLWFGLLQGGAFLGQPYMIFSGIVDKPTVDTSPETSSITLALENRLANLQRPSNRKYTAADQRLQYPTDMFFDWVEILQEISLTEGQ